MATNPSGSGAPRRYPARDPRKKVVNPVALAVGAQKRRKEVKAVGESFTVPGSQQVCYFRAIEVNGVRVNVEDTALITPFEDEDIKNLRVAIIKEITQDSITRKLMVKVQWLYRPEKAEKEGGGSWVKKDSRLLYYSFKHDIIEAESVMHQCTVHFIPWCKQLPDYKKHPGFVVKNLYDFKKKRLVKLTDVIARREEIDLLLGKTMKRLGDLPDSQGKAMSRSCKERVEATKKLRIGRRETPRVKFLPENVVRREKSDLLRGKTKERLGDLPMFLSYKKREVATKKLQIERREISRVKVSPEDQGRLKYRTILLKSNALTDKEPRNKWLEKILQALEPACTEGENQLTWPDSAVAAAAALEKACNETRENFSKYNQKMRSLGYNLEKNIILARRFLKQEFGPLTLLEMNAIEMKEGLTAEELANRNRREEHQLVQLQLTDARCRVCSKKKVVVAEMVKAGAFDRYKLECQVCGRSWYASRDEFSVVATTTNKAPSDAPPDTGNPLISEKKDEQPEDSRNPKRKASGNEQPESSKNPKRMASGNEQPESSKNPKRKASGNEQPESSKNPKRMANGGAPGRN